MLILGLVSLPLLGRALGSQPYYFTFDDGTNVSTQNTWHFGWNHELKCLLNDFVEHVGVVQVVLHVDDVVPGLDGHQVGVAGGVEMNTDTLVSSEERAVKGVGGANIYSASIEIWHSF